MLRAALLVSVVFVAFTSPVQAGEETQTWGGVKALYRSGTLPEPKRPEPVTENERDRAGFRFPGGDWSSRVAWEARYALSRRADGTSTWPVPNNRYGPRWLGDWNYIASDPWARDRAVVEGFGIVGSIVESDGHHHGGECTYFVRLVLYRATYWAWYGSHLTTPNYPHSVYSWCDPAHMTRNFSLARPGWILSSPGRHMAICDRRARVNGRPGWYVIDSNWVGGRGRGWIGRHFLPDAELSSDGYWAWCPTWATTN